MKLDWENRQCADSECKMVHLHCYDEQSDEVFGQVCGPNGFGYYMVIHRGESLGDYRSSPAGMHALTKRVEDDDSKPDKKAVVRETFVETIKELEPLIRSLFPAGTTTIALEAERHPDTLAEFACPCCGAAL